MSRSENVESVVCFRTKSTTKKKNTKTSKLIASLEADQSRRFVHNQRTMHSFPSRSRGSASSARSSTTAGSSQALSSSLIMQRTTASLKSLDKRILSLEEERRLLFQCSAAQQDEETYAYGAWSVGSTSSTSSPELLSHTLSPGPSRLMHHPKSRKGNHVLTGEDRLIVLQQKSSMIKEPKPTSASEYDMNCLRFIQVAPGMTASDLKRMIEN